MDLGDPYSLDGITVCEGFTLPTGGGGGARLGCGVPPPPLSVGQTPAPY